MSREVENANALSYVREVLGQDLLRLARLGPIDDEGRALRHEARNLVTMAHLASRCVQERSTVTELVNRTVDVHERVTVYADRYEANAPETIARALLAAQEGPREEDTLVQCPGCEVAPCAVCGGLGVVTPRKRAAWILTHNAGK